jgi:hypothetical protein
MHDTRNAAITPHSAAYGAEVALALLVAVGMQRDEVEQGRDRHCCDHGGQEHVPKRVVVLLLHGETLHERVADLKPHRIGATR